MKRHILVLILLFLPLVASLACANDCSDCNPSPIPGFKQVKGYVDSVIYESNITYVFMDKDGDNDKYEPVIYKFYDVAPEDKKTLEDHRDDQEKIDILYKYDDDRCYISLIELNCEAQQFYALMSGFVGGVIATIIIGFVLWLIS